MYKVKNGTSPEIMNEIFPLREDNQCSLGQVSQFIARHVTTC